MRLSPSPARRVRADPTKGRAGRAVVHRRTDRGTALADR
ncbi:hypothetical protein [Alloactinosynnema sp. L-07]|nr:hypothetical protein [Alloactinosynnema sp. L-07]